ncbi:glycosyltransferase [Prosthecobacter sp. SYSU 5D2]
MKVLFITGNFPPLSGGLNGGALVALRVARSLVRSGVGCGVFNGETAQNFNGRLRKKVWNGMPTWSLSVGDSLLTPKGGETEVAAALLAVCREFEPDLIHVFQYECWHGQLGEALERTGAVPVVFTALDFGPFCARSTLVTGQGDICEGNPGREKCSSCLMSGRTPLIRWVRRASSLLPERAVDWPFVATVARDAAGNRKRLGEALENWPAFLRVTRRWIAPSIAMSEKLRAHGVNPSAIDHVPYGFDAAPARSKKVHGGDIVFGYAGRPVYEKGFHLMTAAFARVAAVWPNVRLLLFVAKSELFRPYAADARRCLLPFEERIEWGEFDGADEKSIAVAHSKIHCMIVPSVWLDNLPLTVVESLANGTPVIASTHSSAAEPIQCGHNGLLFNWLEKGALATQMERFVADASLRENLLANASYTRGYSDEAASILKTYASCLQETGFATEPARAPFRTE